MTSQQLHANGEESTDSVVSKPDTSLDTIEGVHSFTLELVTQRLTAAKLNIANVEQRIIMLQLCDDIDPCLWQKIFSTPLQVADSELGAAFRIFKDPACDSEPCQSRKRHKGENGTLSLGPEGGIEDSLSHSRQNKHLQENYAFKHYIRSFKMQKQQLIKMINFWWAESVLFEEMFSGVSQTDALKDTDHIYLRYVGMSAQKDTSSRHDQDPSGRNSGLLAAFQSYLVEREPAVLDGVTLVELRWPSDVDTSNMEIASRLEQTLIALLDPNTLLNRQLGGNRYDFVHDSDVHNDVQDIGLESHKSILRSNTSSNLMEELASWCEKSFKASQKVQQSRGHSVTPAFLEEITAGATPLVVQGISICLQLFSGAPPLHAFMNNARFWKQGSRSSEMTISCLNRLFEYEGMEISGNNPLISQLPTQSMRNWPAASQIEAARNLLNEYLQITAPLVVLAYGREAAFYSLSGYQHLVWNNARNPLTDIVGYPRLIQAPEYGYMIVIPCFHPGTQNYGPGASQFRQIFQTAHIMFLLAVQLAIEEVERGLRDREPICHAVIKRIRKVSIESGLGKKLVSQRNAVTEAWTHSGARFLQYCSMHSYAKDSTNRQYLCLENFRTAGAAKESSYSTERSRQVAQLWTMNIPSLHLSIEHTDYRRQEWETWMRSIRHGGSYYVRALEVAPLDEFERVLRPWIDANEHWKDSWKHSKETRRLVANDAYWSWLRATTYQGIGPDNMLVPLKPTYPRSLKGRVLRWKLGIHTSWVCLDFEEPNGTKSELFIRTSKSLRPRDEDDLWVINFTEKGIIITNKKGELQIVSGKEHKADQSVTFDIPHIGSISVCFGSDAYDPLASLKLIELWERETRKDFDQELAHITGDWLPDEDSKTLEFDTSAELVPINRVTPKSGIKSLNSQRPRPTDGAWLLWQFLLRIPNNPTQRRFCISHPRL